MPKPSYGCMECRRRRVKCRRSPDGKCFNCETYGVQCPGCPNQIDALLRPQRIRQVQSARMRPRVREELAPVKNSAVVPTKHEMSLRGAPNVDNEFNVNQTGWRIPQAIANCNVARTQLFANFVDATHFSSSASQSERRRAMDISFIGHLQSVPYSSTLIPLAIEALTLGFVAYVREDDRLLQAARSCRGKALTALRAHLQNVPSVSGVRPHWETIASIMLVSTFDCYSPSFEQLQNEWLTHLWGVQRYIDACGPLALNLEEPYHRVLAFAIYNTAIILGIASRKALDLKVHQYIPPKAEWTKETPWDIFHTQARYTIFQPLPALLEKTDKLLDETNPRVDLVRGLYQEITRTRCNVLASTEDTLLQIEPSSVSWSDPRTFDTTIEEHRFMMSSVLFTEFSQFSCVEAAVDYINIVLPLLVLDCTLLRILCWKPLDLYVSATEEFQYLEVEAFDLARRLCKSISYFSKLESLSYAYYTIHLLSLAQNVFEEQSALGELGWCRGCLIAIRARIDRVEPTRPPTLCRAKNLPQGLASAGRYRAR